MKKIIASELTQNDEGRQLTDTDKKAALTNNSTRRPIAFFGNTYLGPKALFDAIDKPTDHVGYKCFHLNYSNWRRDNPKSKPTDIDIIAFITPKTVKGLSGTRISPLRDIYERYEHRKIGWPWFQSKVSKLTKELKRNLEREELIELSHPYSMWIQDVQSLKFLTTENRVITKEKFHELLECPKVSFSGWNKRLRAFKRRHQRTVNEEEAIVCASITYTQVASRWDIYIITNLINENVYIGVTSEGLAERFRNHKRQSITDKRPTGGLHEAIAAFGFGNFSITLLETHNSEDETVKREIELISEHKSLCPYGYNLDSGGKGLTGSVNPIEFEGIFYKNRNALATAYNIPVKRLESRLRNHWTIQQAIRLPRNVQKDKKFNFEAERSIAELARENSIDPKKVYERLSGDWTINQALGIEPAAFNNFNAKKTPVRGQEFQSIRAAAKYFGTPEGTARKRLKLGWSIEDSILGKSKGLI